jgi:asparagine synthase (glutamine-hydrolysing)
VCGIAGILRAHDAGADDRALVGAMLERLVRRGPDDAGTEQCDALTLGHRRLSIVDLSAAGHQPMWSASRSHLLSFNGEIYNHAELRDELGLRSEDLRSTSDTEILLHAWQRLGPAALDRLAGQWAIALYDASERRLWLARDRFGEKPLFYQRSPECLTFASSIPALLALPWVSRELDPDALAEYVTLRYAVAPRTVVAGIAKLPPGHLLVADRRGVEVRRWYRPQFRAPGPRPSPRRQDELADEFGALLAQASRRCTVSDVPVALLLSEGIDSNALRHALAANGAHVPSFTYAMAESGTGLHRLPPADASPEPWELRVDPRGRLEQIVPAFSSFTEPLGDGAALATWLLIRNARERATVFLCGHGADEVIGGYRLSQDRFRLGAIHYAAWLPAWSMRLLIDSKVFGAEPAAVRQRALLRAPLRRVPAAARYLIHRPLPPGDVAQLLGRDDPPYLEVVDRLYAECDGAASGLDRIQEVMLRTFLSENILSFADSVAMDSSAELRMPYLDRDLVDFVFGLHPILRVSPWPGRANTKQVLRRWAQRHLPEGIAARRKWGFNYGSVRDFLSRDRATFLDLVLGASAVRRALPGLERWLEQPVADFRAAREGTLWAILALAVWCEAAGVR